MQALLATINHEPCLTSISEPILVTIQPGYFTKQWDPLPKKAQTPKEQAVITQNKNIMIKVAIPILDSTESQQLAKNKPKHEQPSVQQTS